MHRTKTESLKLAKVIRSRNQSERHSCIGAFKLRSSHPTAFEKF